MKTSEALQNAYDNLIQSGQTKECEYMQVLLNEIECYKNSEELEQEFYAEYFPEENHENVVFTVIKSGDFVEVPNIVMEYNTIYDYDNLYETFEGYSDGIYKLTVKEIEDFKGQYGEYNTCEIAPYKRIEKCTIDRIGNVCDYRTPYDYNFEDYNAISDFYHIVKNTLKDYSVEYWTNYYINKFDWEFELNIYKKVSTGHMTQVYKKELKNSDLEEVLQDIQKLK